MQENGYCMCSMITSDYRLGCYCDDLSYYTVFTMSFAFARKRKFLLCKKTVKKCGTWVGLQEKLMKVNMFEMTVQIDNNFKDLVLYASDN